MVPSHGNHPSLGKNAYKHWHSAQERNCETKTICLQSKSCASALQPTCFIKCNFYSENLCTCSFCHTFIKTINLMVPMCAERELLWTLNRFLPRGMKSELDLKSAEGSSWNWSTQNKRLSHFNVQQQRTNKITDQSPAAAGAASVWMQMRAGYTWAHVCLHRLNLPTAAEA